MSFVGTIGFAIMALCSVTLMPAMAQKADILLSPPDPIQYFLPNDIRIQSAASIGNVTVVVWGTTATDSANPVVNRLVLQRLVGSVPTGAAIQVCSPDARPYGLVRVLGRGNTFLVLWNDRRTDLAGTYMRRLDAAGNWLGGEDRISESQLVDVRNFAPYPKESFLLFDKLPILVVTEAGIDWQRVISMCRLDLPACVNPDSSVVVLQGNDVMRYRNAFDTAPVHIASVGFADSVIQESKYIVQDKSGNIHLYYMATYFTNLRQILNFQTRRIDIGSDSSMAPAVHLDSAGDLWIPQNGVMYCGIDGADKGWNCDNSFSMALRFHDGTVHGLVPHVFGYQIDSDGKYYKLGTLSISPSCPLAERVAVDTVSRIELLVAGTNLELQAPCASHQVDVQQSSPALVIRGGSVLLTWLNATSPPFAAGTWLGGASTPMVNMFPFAPDRIPDQDVYYLAVQQYLKYDAKDFAPRGPGYSLGCGLDSREDMVLTGSSDPNYQTQLAYTDRIKLYMPTASTYVPAFQLNAGQIQPGNHITHTLESAAFDPATARLMCTIRSYMNFGNYWRTVISIDTAGNLAWQIKEFYPEQSDIPQVPIGNSEFLTVKGNHYVRYQGTDTVESFDLPSTSTTPHLMRLLGGYFLRWYVAEPATSLMLEKYDLHGRRIASVAVPFEAPVTDPFVIEKPLDSSITLLYSRDGIRLAHLDAKLRPGVNNIPVSISRTAVLSPTAVYHGDTLYCAWVDRNNGSGDIRGTIISTLPTSNVAVEPAGTGESVLQLSAVPNPASDHLSIRVDGEAGNAWFSITSLDGKLVASKACNGTDPGGLCWQPNLALLPAGVYMIAARVGSGIIHRQISIIH